jgi:predicted phosphodiesterase
MRLGKAQSCLDQGLAIPEAALRTQDGDPHVREIGLREAGTYKLGSTVSQAKKKPAPKGRKEVVKAKPSKVQRKSAEDLIKDLQASGGTGGNPKTEALIKTLCAEIDRLRSRTAPPKIVIRKGKASKNTVEVIIPDSHGEHIDLPARDAFLSDLARIKPDTIIMLGDHLDAGGTFSSHQRNYTHEMTESYDSDVHAANEFLDLIQVASPNSRIHYLSGNHEQHIERWVARTFDSYADAKMVLDRLGPEAVLRLKERGITYYQSGERYMGLSIPGTIRLGKCFYTHGVSHGRHATATHLDRFGASVWHGHTHRAQSVISRTVTSDGLGAWCPGTLAKLQPLYRHTAPTQWSHGYGLQFTSVSSGNFSAMLVPILDGESMLLSEAIVGR